MVLIVAIPAVVTLIHPLADQVPRDGLPTTPKTLPLQNPPVGAPACGLLNGAA